MDLSTTLPSGECPRCCIVAHVHRLLGVVAVLKTDAFFAVRIPNSAASWLTNPEGFCNSLNIARNQHRQVLANHIEPNSRPAETPGAAL